MTGRMPFELALLRVCSPWRSCKGRAGFAGSARHSTSTKLMTGTWRSTECAGLLRGAGAAVPRRRRKDLVRHLIASAVTAREAKVLKLVEEGLPNAAIAERLYVSVRTVESHVSSLLSKLAVASRAELRAECSATARAPRPLSVGNRPQSKKVF